MAVLMIRGSLRKGGGIKTKIVAESKTVVNRNSFVGSGRYCNSSVIADLLENLYLNLSFAQKFCSNASLRQRTTFV